MKESARYILPILVFVATILTFGTVGYLLIEEDISASDAFYMTVTAITPTQFDEVHNLSVPGRYFTVLLVFCGFGAVVAFATQFARLIIQSELEGVGVITRKQMRRRIRRMKNHYIVCGYGEIGSAICGQLQQQQFPFVVITDDASSVDAVTRDGYALVSSNPTTDKSLKEAGIDRAVGVIAILNDDADNLFIALAARELNPQILIIARGENSSVEDRILRAGADIVVSPMKLGGRQIAELIRQQAGGPSAPDRMQLQSHVMGMQLSVYRHGGDRAVSVASVMQETNAVGVAGIERDDGRIEYCPHDAEIRPGEAAVLIVKVASKGEVFHSQPSGKTILLADDHRALRLLFSRKLASAGHHVIQAASGDEAIRLAKSGKPDLVVLDVNMPRKDGYEACRALRAIDQLAGVPIILYSGQETEEFIERGRQAGASRCIRKTSKSSELLEEIEELFSTDEPSNDSLGGSSAPGIERICGDLLDLDIAIKNVNGDEQLLVEILGLVREETLPLLEQIQRSIDPLDHATLTRAAHTLKTSLAVVGAADASDAARKLEEIDVRSESRAVNELNTSLVSKVEPLLARLAELSSKQPSATH